MSGRRAVGLLLAAAWLALGDSAPAQPRETPAQMRRIVAQSLCLATAYPDSAIARDAEAVYTVYATLTGARDPLAARKKTEALAAAENPAKPTPVGGHNLALAKCALFADRADVQALWQARRAAAK
ncbi:MAG: hypothetical protein IT162_10835 [Bryobacterales bacterium]|nr:hypothetical protein [Bryobacterales bacterium]